ncbi:hypothetical protein NpNSSI1_00012321 [Neofusicoccum parvum]|nr:hypothetical protein NpNSSI1_00012321 [Neofusicoccum parvum]
MVDNDVLAPVLGAILFGAAGSVIIVAAAGHSGDIELQDLAAPQPARLRDDHRSRRRGQPPPYRPEDWERFPPPPLYSHELGEYVKPHFLISGSDLLIDWGRNNAMTLSQDEVGPFPRAGIPRTRSA